MAKFLPALLILECFLHQNEACWIAKLRYFYIFLYLNNMGGSGLSEKVICLVPGGQILKENILPCLC